MLVLYMSLTGNVKDFVEKTGLKIKEIEPSNPFFKVNEDFVIVVPSYEGYINEEVEDLLSYKDNLKFLRGFASSGNLNFDELFCVNAKQLSKKFNKPLFFMFEYSGTDRDVNLFLERLGEIEKG
jgi:protein involved in ribonucleotide reduction